MMKYSFNITFYSWFSFSNASMLLVWTVHLTSFQWTAPQFEWTYMSGFHRFVQISYAPSSPLFSSPISSPNIFLLGFQLLHWTENNTNPCHFHIPLDLSFLKTLILIHICKVNSIIYLFHFSFLCLHLFLFSFSQSISSTPVHWTSKNFHKL